MPSTSPIDVLIIGGGLSGICAAVRLRTLYPSSTFSVYESASGPGGSWYHNRYPGAACDTPSTLYSYSFAPKPDWTCVLPPAGEILRYLDGVIARFGVRENIRCGVQVTSCRWDEERSLWVVGLKRKEEEWTQDAKAVLSCTGILNFPRYPDLREQGVDRFQGRVLHSARWPGDVVVEGKNIVVLGSGCSAAQIVPSLSQHAKHVTQIYRSSTWPAPFNPNHAFPPWAHWANAHIPFFQKLARTLLFLRLEHDRLLFKIDPQYDQNREAHKEECKAFIAQMAPQKYYSDLVPDYEYGCKRKLVNNGYYESLHKDNVQLVKGPITGFSENAVQLEGKEIPADILVCATGYQTNSFVPDITVTGRDGVDLQSHWKEHGGPYGFNTTAVDGFPNLFFVLGPNTATGHNSTLMAIETTVDYALKALKPVLTDDAHSIEIDARAAQNYAVAVQEALTHFSWGSSCTSWYKTATGQNFITYPWSQYWFWWENRRVDWSVWHVTKIQKKKRQAWSKTGFTVVAALLVLVAGLAAREGSARGLVEPVRRVVNGSVGS